jgi:hypothetical protein
LNTTQDGILTSIEYVNTTQSTDIANIKTLNSTQDGNIVIYFKTQNWDIISNFLDFVPIKHQANGSIVSIKGSDPWMDYSYVTTIDELNEFLIYLEHFQWLRQYKI